MSAAKQIYEARDVISRYEALSPKPSLNHLAELSELSTSTVSRVLENKETVRSKTYGKIIAGISAYEVELGLRPNPANSTGSNIHSFSSFEAPKDFSPNETQIIELLKAVSSRLDGLTDEYAVSSRNPPDAFVKLLQKHSTIIQRFHKDIDNQ